MADVSGVRSLAQHWDVLWYLVTVLFGALVGLIWRMLNRMEKKLDAMPDNFASTKAFEKMVEDRESKWKMFYRHRHHPSGEVDIP